MIFVGYLDRATNKLLSSGKSTFRQVRIYIIFVFYSLKKNTKPLPHYIKLSSNPGRKGKKDRKRIIIKKKPYIFHDFLCNSKHSVYVIIMLDLTSGLAVIIYWTASDSYIIIFTTYECVCMRVRIQDGPNYQVDLI